MEHDRFSSSAAPSGQPGRVLAVTGSQATIGLLLSRPGARGDTKATVGRYLGIRSGESLLIGVITDVDVLVPPAVREEGFTATAHLDLMGEIRRDRTGASHFQRGVAEYPAIGDAATLMSPDELRLMFTQTGGAMISIGHLQQDETIEAQINADDMLSKHFAVLGTTGVGKSSGVAIILERLMAVKPNVRVFLVDPHNEYGRFFSDKAQILTPRNLKLPFWLFNFEEMVDVIFGARPGVEEEVEILSEVIPLAKSNYTQYRNSGADRSVLKRTDPRLAGYTVDTPVPYRLADLIALIDERMGKLENRSSRVKYNRLIQRIETIRNDPRYAFMFDNANVGGDTMAETLGQLFRLPPNGKPMTIMQIAGFPSEVVDAVMSVLCRMAFDFGLWSEGAFPLLFVCEEAHRYAAAERSIGFGPTRRSISRIAKEGRKYGVFLGLVSQRPAELDPTILSQCSTLFTMRMSNDRDQGLLRAAVMDGAANLLAFVPSLGTREVFAFGEGVALPTRLKFRELPTHLVPKNVVGANQIDAEGGANPEFLAAIIERWRGATMSNRARSDDGAEAEARYGDDAVASAPQHTMHPPPLTPAPPLSPALPRVEPAAAPTTLDPDRFRILKRPLAAQGAGSEPPPLSGPLRPPSRPVR